MAMRFTSLVPFFSLSAHFLLCTGCDGQLANSDDASVTLDANAVDDRMRDALSDKATGDGGHPILPGDAGVSVVMDAEPQDACLLFALNPDAAPGTRAFTPAGVACTTAADCTVYPCVRISRDGDRSFRGIVTTCFATSCPSISPS
jgi:hypothetical protein